MRQACVLVCLAAGLVAAPPLRASDQLRLSYRAGLVQPGDVLRLAVAAPVDVSAVTATWHDREVPFVRDADGVWRALLGVDVDAAVGAKPLRLTGARASGVSVASSETLTIAPKAVRTRRIRVNPKFVVPPKSEMPRIERETKLLNAVFRTTSKERLWALDAVRPVEGVAAFEAMVNAARA
ncbi:MAG: hypothetical protein ABI880_15940, partial [Acidobacteriota bacterium]